MKNEDTNRSPMWLFRPEFLKQSLSPATFSRMYQNTREQSDPEWDSRRLRICSFGEHESFRE
jgi:hypothetical protein